MLLFLCFGERNLASVSVEKEGPLSAVNHFGGPYWDISCCNFCMMKTAVLDDVL